MKTVEKTSVFPVPRKEIFRRIQKLETLQAVAWPYATFTPVDPDAGSNWAAGSVRRYQFRLFGWIPFGIHTIRITRFDEDIVQSREGNEHVPVWNHTIYMKLLDESHTQYTDYVEIEAGWKTVIVWLWAKCFYRHRQKKWIQLLKEDSKKLF